MEERFRNREEAGQVLARHLRSYADRRDAVVLGLPRGGVKVAFEAARLLSLPLDVFMVRKLGVPGQPELAMGAIASGGSRVVNRDIVHQLNISEAHLETAARRETTELRRQERFYRNGRPAVTLGHKTVILIDDGLAMLEREIGIEEMVKETKKEGGGDGGFHVGLS